MAGLGDGSDGRPQLTMSPPIAPSCPFVQACLLLTWKPARAGGPDGQIWLCLPGLSSWVPSNLGGLDPESSPACRSLGCWAVLGLCQGQRAEPLAMLLAHPVAGVRG